MFKSLLFSLLTVGLIVAVVYFSAVSAHRVVRLAFTRSLVTDDERLEFIEREVRQHANRPKR